MSSKSSYEILITRRAEKDIHRLTPFLQKKIFEILTEIIAPNPYVGKKLLGDLGGSYSYRLTYQDRIVYSIDEKKRCVYVERGRTHYGD